jgi:ribosomal protein S18 acetylase RimI-like enzyme
MDAWGILWPIARKNLSNGNVTWAAAISLHPWFGEILAASSFSNVHNVIVLECKNDQISLPETTDKVIIRKMMKEDLIGVQWVDECAFGVLWRNSLEQLSLAFECAKIATVAEDESGIVGYQISTPSHRGAHLSRLAVLPEVQGQGIGYSLVRFLLVDGFSGEEPRRVTVNTQNNNHASIAVYKKAGFTFTGEEYPVLCYDVKTK